MYQKIKHQIISNTTHTKKFSVRKIENGIGTKKLTPSYFEHDPQEI